MGNLSSAIRERRKALGLTLAQIAVEMGVSEATVQRWESGNIKALRYGKIDKLAEVLKTTPAYLMGWSESDDGSTILAGLAEQLNEDEQQLLEAYRSLNREGRKQAMMQVEIISHLSQYKKCDSNQKLG